MLAAAALLDRVAHGEFEGDFAAVDLHDLASNRDLQAQRRGRQVIDRDVRADRVLARVEVLEQEVAAGVLDVAHHARRGVDHAFLAHEADAAGFVDGDALVSSRPAFSEGFMTGILWRERGLLDRGS